MFGIQMCILILLTRNAMQYNRTSSQLLDIREKTVSRLDLRSEGGALNCQFHIQGSFPTF